MALELAEQAATAALDGHIEQARQAFAKILAYSTNVQAFELAIKFIEKTVNRGLPMVGATGGPGGLPRLSQVPDTPGPGGQLAPGSVAKVVVLRGKRVVRRGTVTGAQEVVP